MERRVFYFLERCNSEGERAQPPHFVNLRGHAGIPWQAGEGFAFELSFLRDCFTQSDEWKRQVGFPVEVRELVETNSESGIPDWQHVIVDRLERLLVVRLLASSKNHGARLVIFAARQEGWTLQAADPVIVDDRGGQEFFPDLADQSSPDLLKNAWQAWAKSRGLKEAEIETCAFALEGHQLRVLPPPALIDQLRASRSDVFKGDTWLLLGESHIRNAVQLELVI
jgi:hypothetical protein